MPAAPEMQDKIKVAVRVRPLNRREIEMKTPVVVDMNDNQTYLYSSGAAYQKGDEKSTAVKPFAFDECFWSVDPENNKFAGQEIVFERLGIDVMENAFKGYNACIFAYGQTGSGKSYTMMGTPNQPGIIPRLCNSLFEEIARKESSNLSYKTEVSYMEIYNEKVHDLLDVQGLSSSMSSNQRKSLRVREHNILGPYVDGLSQLVVTCLADIEKLMIEGNKSRTVASTNMNSESSRSHAVFNIILTETIADPMADVTGEKKSKISLVDLAGSERAQKTGAVGERLREGCNINKSLTTLMLVISALADASNASIKKSKSGNKTAGFVPYRDSVLTWLLKDNLGGNSKTVMVATLSPAADNYEETLSTLRYADRAKRIINHAVVNEDPNAKIIRELREQVEELKKELENAKERQAPDLKEKLEESENIIKQLSKTWEEKLIETEKKHKERHEALEKMGISVQTSGIKVEMSKFYLVNLNADPSLNELLVYYLKDITEVGRGPSQDIQLHGLGIQEKHCIFEIVDNEVFLIPLENARTLLNGKDLKEKTKIHNKDRILWGMNHFFRLNCPRKMNVPENDVSMCGEDFSQAEEFQKAQEEVMMAELQNDPIQQAISDLEKHHIAEKEEALTRQRIEYEKQLEALKEQLVPVNGNEKPEESIRQMSPQNSNLMSMSQYSGSMMNLPPAHGSYAAAAAAMASNQDSSNSFYDLNNLSISSQSVNASGLWPSSVPMPTWMGSQANIFATPNNLQLVQAKYQSWVEQREHSLAQVLVKLREQLSKANALTREANFLADEMAKSTEYSVTLQIPAASLNPNGKKGGIISEPAILVKRDNKSSQIWSLEKLENKVVEMRDLYEEWKDTSYPTRMPLENPFNQNSTSSSGEDIIKDDPFFDAQEDHNLIGVANIYLSCLFQKIKFKYQVPIINQQGEISGKLAVELSVVKGELPDLGTRESSAMTTSIYSQSQNQTSMTSSIISGPNYNYDYSDDTSGPSRSTSGYSLGSSVTVRVRILQATYLPEHLSHFVFCQYHFWGEDDSTVVPPALQPDYVQRNTDKTTFKFNHSTDFHVMLTDELLEHFAENALSIEVYGNRNPGFAVIQECERSLGNMWDVNNKTSSSSKLTDSTINDGKQTEDRIIGRKFGDRWIELYRRLEFWVCIEELNEKGQYQKVDLKPSSNSYFSDIATGGQFQLKHGQTRRVRVFVRTNKLSRGCRGSLPLICDKVQEVSIGDIFVIKKNNIKYPDSYQEEDLNRLRDSWSIAVCKRQEYLNEQLQKLVNITNKSSTEEERENSLMKQWMRLTEERNAVLVPAAGSGIPGAPATWSPVDGMEKHCPLIFLNIKNEELSTAGASALSDPGPVPCGIDNQGNVSVMSGGNCILNGCNDESDFINLPLVKRYETLCGAVAQWDSSLHDSILLNSITQTGDRVYVTVRAVIRLTHPALVDLVLRKRICINIYKSQTFTSFFKKKLTSYISDDDSLRSVWNGVTYQIVSGIPQNSLDIEDRESLAQLAASQTEKSVSSGDQESYIEKYIRSVSAVESLLQVDRIRQEVACQEMITLMRKQRRSIVQIPSQPDPLRRGPIIGNPNVIPSSITPYNNVLLNGDSAGLKKYISVPDFQGMYRSSSLTNLKASVYSPVSSESKFPSKDHEEMNYESVKSGSISNLSKLSDDAIINSNNNNNNLPNVTIKSPLIPKRPQPPKNLLMVSKNSLMSPLSNINQSNASSHNPTNNSRSDIKTMHTLKEEKPRQNLNSDKLSCIDNANEVDSIEIEYDESKMKLNRSVTEDSLTRSKSSGYGSSLTVSSLKPGVTTNNNNNHNPSNNNNDESEIDTATICGSPDTSKQTTNSNAKDLKPKMSSINSQSLKIGTRVSTINSHGETLYATVKYFNSTQFETGLWVGLELDENKGNHNGTVNDVKYFTCAHNHGFFTRPDNVFIVK